MISSIFNIFSSLSQSSSSREKVTLVLEKKLIDTLETTDNISLIRTSVPIQWDTCI